jgi:hypothetical protein
MRAKIESPRIGRHRQGGVDVIGGHPAPAPMP